MKKQKLSLEAPDPVTGFQSSITVSDNPTDSPEEYFIPLQRNFEAEAFGLPKNFWDLIATDPGLRAEFDELIEKKIQERLEVRHEAMRKEISQNAHAAGLKQGMEEGRAKLAEELKRIDDFCAELLKQKVQVLREHELLWSETFGHLLRRFLVPNAAEKTELLRNWLSESLERFGATKKVRVYFSPADLEALQQTSPMRLDERWEYLSDANLKSGEIHCECDAGGIFFSPDRQLESLDLLVAQFKRSLEDTKI